MLVDMYILYKQKQYHVNIFLVKTVGQFNIFCVWLGQFKICFVKPSANAKWSLV